MAITNMQGMIAQHTIYPFMLIFAGSGGNLLVVQNTHTKNLSLKPTETRPLQDHGVIKRSLNRLPP